MMVEAEVERAGTTTIARRYYLSAQLDPAFARAVRAHWRIENRLHWVLDVVFRDDLVRLRTGHGPENKAVNLVRARPVAGTASRSSAKKPPGTRTTWTPYCAGPPECLHAIALRPRPGDKWHLDEVFIRIRGKLHYLWRAVDQHGTVLVILVQSRRSAKAAKRFFKKLLRNRR